MKNWNAWAWICIAYTCTNCIIQIIYFSGMFILKQQTNETNLPLRMEIIRNSFLIQAQILAIAYVMITGKRKDDENKNKL